MPFKSDSQRKLCYLLKGKGQAGSWDCDEWSTATGKKKLPEHVEDQEEKQALNKKSGVNSLISKWSVMSGHTKYSNGLLKGGAAGGPVQPPKPGVYKSVFSTPPRLKVGAPPVGPTAPAAPAPAAPAPAPAAPAPAAGTPPANGFMGYANQAFNSAKSGFSGVMGSVQSSPAYNNASLAYQNRGAIAPTAWNAVQAGFGSDDAKTRLDADANRFNWSEAKDRWSNIGNDLKGLKDRTMATINTPEMQKKLSDSYVKNLSPQQKDDIQKRYSFGRYGGPLGWAEGANFIATGAVPKRVTEGEKARLMNGATGTMNWLSGIGSSVGGAIVNNPVSQAIGTGVKNYATQSEAKRMTAQATMPYVDWMRANPWAKYVGGGLALGAGAYGLHKIFGGGGGASEADADEGEGDNFLTKSFNRGLNPAPVGRSRRYA
jgi:hypothetical protein